METIQQVRLWAASQFNKVKQEEHNMTFINLIEAIASHVTADNIENFVSLVEKLVDLGEAINKQNTSSTGS